MTEYEFDGFLPLACCRMGECLDAAGIDGHVPAWSLARDTLRTSSTPSSESCGETTR